MTLFYSDGWNMVHGNVKHYDDTDEDFYKVIYDHTMFVMMISIMFVMMV